MAKTFASAVVLIPPQDLWEPIQHIRQRHDKQIRRWMPHVTLLYPFHGHEEFDALDEPLRQALRPIEPFLVELTTLKWFIHGRDSFTLWFAPDPADKLDQLQAALQSAAPDCDDVRHHGQFVPHLSVGQVYGERALQAVVAAIQSSWRPLHFVAREVSLIWRPPPPEDVFQVDRTVLLGGKM